MIHLWWFSNGYISSSTKSWHLPFLYSWQTVKNYYHAKFLADSSMFSKLNSRRLNRLILPPQWLMTSAAADGISILIVSWAAWRIVGVPWLNRVLYEVYIYITAIIYMQQIWTSSLLKSLVFAVTRWGHLLAEITVVANHTVQDYVALTVYSIRKAVYFLTNNILVQALDV